MRGDSVGSNRARFSNDQAQQAVTFGKMPDLGNLPLSHTGVDESGQASVGGFHAERAVVRFEEMSRDVDYLLQGFVELECGPDGQHGTEQFGNCSRVESSQLCASGDVAEKAEHERVAATWHGACPWWRRRASRMASAGEWSPGRKDPGAKCPHEALSPELRPAFDVRDPVSRGCVRRSS